VEPTAEEFARTDCVVIATDYDAVDPRPIVENVAKAVDPRNAVRRRLGYLPENVDVL
jgi:hypothetical protein